MAGSRTVRNAEPIQRRLEHVVAKQLSETMRRGQTVTAALSGGIDSVVLLDLLRRVGPALGVRLRALHVNHALSPNADLWEQFCRTHCGRREIPFQAARVSVRGKANIEAQARSARYDAFREFGSEVIALAHNRDDQAETVLLNLLRGAGVHGLSGMPAVRILAPRSRSSAKRESAQNAVQLLRPLLAVPRADIEAYARRRRLHWIEDESNAELRFTRNFLRGNVLPLLERRFPGCRETLARSATHLSEAAQLLDELAELDYAAVTDAGQIQVVKLRALSRARAVNVLRAFLASRGEPPLSTARTAEILRQLCSERADAQPQLALEGGSLRRFRGRIELVPFRPVDVQAVRIPWNWEQELILPGGDTLGAMASRGKGVSRARLAAQPVIIRWREGGERIQLDPLRPRRTLKNLLQESGVEPWRRSRMPLVFCGDDLVWVPDVGVACEFRARPREASIRFHWKEAVEP
jgi:tRNA(Ile)-lysidine synthase